MQDVLFKRLIRIILLSGPGYPVCVTSESYIDAAIELLKDSNVILSTFGDMMKVNGSEENLIEQREKGKDIKVLYSPLDSITLAEENKDKQIIFLGVGFETTTPLISLAIKMAHERMSEGDKHLYMNAYRFYS